LIDCSDAVALKAEKAKRPRHRETSGCCTKKHKQSKATKVRGKPRPGESAEQHSLRLQVQSLLKIDVHVQHEPSRGSIEEVQADVGLSRSPIHDMRDLLAVVPVVQLCMMVESIHEMEQAKDIPEVLTEA
jgi:hypothetical protein